MVTPSETAQFNLSEKTISIKELRKDAEIMEKAHINPNLPEVIFAQDVKEFIRLLKENINATHDMGHIDVSYLFDCIDKLAGEKLC